MQSGTTSVTRKATIAPILQVHWDVALDRPIGLLPSRDLSVEDIRGLLTEKHFELWNENLSDNQKKQVAEAKIAVVHRFASSAHIGKDEEESKNLVERVISCLRIIRPTRGSFQTIQLRLLNEGSTDVFRFTHPQEIPPNIPASDVLNTIRRSDFLTLQKVLPRFLDLWDEGPEYVIRAARYFLTGYSGIYEPIAQILIWVAGIEAILSKGKPLPASEVLSSLSRSLDPDWNIYEDTGLAEFTNADVRLQKVSSDLFKLRNSLAHGGWVPSEWTGMVGRVTTTGNVEYADMLREAAAAILRKLLMCWLTADPALR